MRRQAIELATDQAASSLITLTLSVFAAREASVDAFGVFAVAYALFWALLGATRAFVSEVSLIIGPEELESSANWRSLSTTASFGAGIFSAVILFLGCSLIGSADSTVIGLSFAVAAPLAMVADALRYVAFTDDSPRDALALDVTWLAVTLVAPLIIARWGIDAVPAAVLGWGFGAGIAIGLAFLRRSELRPKLAGVVEWVADRRVVGSQFAADFLANNGVGQAITALVPLVSSLAVAGALRAGGIIQGPLNVAFSAIIVFLIPRVRKNIFDNRLLPSPAPIALAGLAVICTLYGATVFLIPDGFGEFLLGASWNSGRVVAPILIAAYFLQGMVLIMVQIMRLRDSAGLVVKVRVFVAVLLSVAVLGGAAAFGAVGAASAFALAALLSLIPWSYALVRSQRRFDSGSS